MPTPTVIKFSNNIPNIKGCEIFPAKNVLLDNSASTDLSKAQLFYNICTLHFQIHHHLYQIHNQGVTISMSKIFCFLTLMSYMNSHSLMLPKLVVLIISVQKFLNTVQGHYF